MGWSRFGLGQGWIKNQGRLRWVKDLVKACVMAGQGLVRVV